VLKDPDKPYGKDTARYLYWLTVKSHDGKTVADFADNVARKAPSQPTRGKLAGETEPISGWLAFFKREGLIQIIEVTDEVLMNRFQNGDEKAFEILYSHYNKNVTKYLRGICDDENHINDLHQDIWETLFKSRNKYDQKKGKFKTYIRMIAKNKNIDRIRRLYTDKDSDSPNVWIKNRPHLRKKDYERKEDSLDEDIKKSIGIEDEQDTKYIYRDERGGMIRNVDTIRKLRKLQECLDKLNNDQREIILKIKAWGYTFDEVLNEVNDTMKETLRKRLYRGINNLRECVGEL